MFSKKLLIISGVLILVVTGGVSYFYFAKKQPQFIEDHSSNCEPIPGRIAVGFRDNIFPKDIQTFAKSHRLTIEDSNNYLSAPIVGALMKKSSGLQGRNIESEREQLKKLFALPEITKVTSGGIKDLATGKDVAPDFRKDALSQVYIEAAPRLTITFTGSEKKIRDAIRDLPDINIVEKKFLDPHPLATNVETLNNPQKLVVQLDHKELFNMINKMITVYSNQVKKVYLTGGDDMRVFFSSDLNHKDVLDLITVIGFQSNEFLEFKDTYKFKVAVFKVPVGQESEWSTRLVKETAFVESAGQQRTVCPI